MWKSPSKNFERDAVAVGRVRVHGHTEVAGDAHLPCRQRLSDRLDVGDPVLHPEVVGPVARVQEELVRHEDLEEHTADVEQARVPGRLQPVEQHDTAEEPFVVLDHRVVVLVHDVHVLDVQGTDRAAHVSGLHADEEMIERATRGLEEAHRVGEPQVRSYAPGDSNPEPDDSEVFEGERCACSPLTSNSAGEPRAQLPL